MNGDAGNFLTFKREGEQIYVVGTLDEQHLDQLDVAMLQAHTPPCLLPLTIGQENQIYEIAYNIGERKPLHEWLRIRKHNISEHEVLQTLLYICNGLLSLRNYLLDEHRSVLMVEWMFVGESISDLRMLYWPDVRMGQEAEHNLATTIHQLCLKLAPHLADMKSLRELLSSFADPVFTLHVLRRRIIHLLDHIEASKQPVVAASRRSGGGGGFIEASKKLLTRLRRHDHMTNRRLVRQTARQVGHNPATYTHPLRSPQQITSRASLLFHPPGQSSMEIAVNHVPFMLGRDARLADWSWDDAKLSRTHAEVKWLGDRYVVRDVGSRNGTYLNGKKLVPYTDSLLTHGDRLELADLSFQFYWEQTEHML